MIDKIDKVHFSQLAHIQCLKERDKESFFVWSRVFAYTSVFLFLFLLIIIFYESALS